MRRPATAFVRVVPVNSHSGVLTSAAFGLVALLTTPGLAETPISVATFKCAEGRSILATFYPDEVDLKLSDSRAMKLPQTISGSGARYANADESVVFWNKGNTAFVTEGPDETMTFKTCVSGK